MSEKRNNHNVLRMVKKKKSDFIILISTLRLFHNYLARICKIGELYAYVRHIYYWSKLVRDVLLRSYSVM